jgi:hypothetical protein
MSVTKVTTPVIDSPGLESGQRNFIIDGDFTQWPEGTSATTHVQNDYSSAMWYTKLSHDGSSTWERSTDVPTIGASGHQSSYSMLIKCTGTDSSIAASQTLRPRFYITGSDFTSLHQQEVTFSFWCKTSSQNSGHVYYFSLSNSAENRTYVQNFTATATWTKFTYTIPLDTSGTWLFTEADIGLAITFSLVSGTTYDDGTIGSWVGSAEFWDSGTAISNFLDHTSNEIYFSQVGLYLGSTAPTFTSEPIATVKDQVDWYVQRSDFDTVTGEAVPFAAGFVSAPTIGTGRIAFRREMRTVPTWTYSGANTFENVNGVTGSQDTSLSAYSLGRHAVQINTTATGMTTGQGITLRRDATDTCWFMLDARH